MRRALVTTSFFVFPAMAGLAAIAEPLIRILLTDKWLMCVPFLQIFCAVYALWPIHTVNLQAINALGRSDIFLRVKICNVVVGLSVLAVAIPFGIYAIGLGMVITGIIGSIINAYPNRQLLEYRYTEQVRDMMPAFIISLIMCGIVYSILFMGFSIWTTLILQIVAGFTVYTGLAWLLKLESLTYVMKTLREYFPSRTTPS